MVPDKHIANVLQKVFFESSISSQTIHSRAVEIHTISFENIQNVRCVQCLIVVRYQLQR